LQQKEHEMPATPQVLRTALVIDAVASGATGLLMVVGAAFLGGLLGLPRELLIYAGLALAPFALFVGWLGMSERPASGAVWAVIGANALWAVASIALLLSGVVSPTPLGYAFVIFQAAVVAVLGEFQFFALRRRATTLAS
jgi:hypothetical protein